MELEQLIVRIEADARPLQSALEGVNAQANRSLASVASWGDRLSTSFVSAAVHGKNLGQAIRGIAQELANSALRQTVINPLGDLLSSALGGLFGRASGGSVSSHQPYLVGERGPELFVPSSAGRIENGSMGSMGSSSSAGGISVGINIDARGADAQAAARLQAVAGEIQSRTFDAVFAAMERGGRYARISGRRS